MELISLLISLTRPLYLLGAVLLYFMGVGIAKYLGVTIQWTVFYLGLAWILLVQISSHALFDYFEPIRKPSENQNSTSNNDKKTSIDEKTSALIRLIVCFSCLAVAGSITVLLMQAHRLTPMTSLFMIAAFLGALLYSLPPVRLTSSGYGELIIAILFANLIPAFAFVLQTETLHRLVAMTTFPLTPLLLAMIIGLEFSTYSRDLKYGNRGLIIRMGWQNAMNLHNILIACCYLLLSIAMIFNLPTFVGIPVLFTLPLGILLIWQMKRIADGKKPNWSVLKISWMVMSFTVVYLMAYSYWIH